MRKNQSDIRAEGRAARSNLSAEERRHASEIICRRVTASRMFEEADTVACYIGVNAEVATQPIFERAYAEKKRIFVPVTKRNRPLSFREILPESVLATAPLGLLEPVNGEEIQPSELDLVITPLVAFDDQRNRVGMGGGYYDRTFSFVAQRNENSKPLLVGVAFECQKAQKITPNPWDIRLFRVITEIASY